MDSFSGSVASKDGEHIADVTGAYDRIDDGQQVKWVGRFLLPTERTKELRRHRYVLLDIEDGPHLHVLVPLEPGVSNSPGMVTAQFQSAGKPLRE